MFFENIGMEQNYQIIGNKKLTILQGLSEKGTISVANKF